MKKLFLEKLNIGLVGGFTGVFIGKFFLKNPNETTLLKYIVSSFVFALGYAVISTFVINLNSINDR